MRLVTSSEMAELDARAQSEFGIPGIVLMEGAAKAAWDFLRDECLGERPGSRVVFVAGPGNNGGDALAMARYCALDARHRPEVILAREKLSPDAQIQRRIVEAMQIPVTVWTDEKECVRLLGSADWIVDGLAGTGLAGRLRQPHADIAAAISRSSARVASVDAPSGVGDDVVSSDGAVMADVTMSLGLPKQCLFDPRHRRRCGRIAVVPFILPDVLTAPDTSSNLLLSEDDLQRLIPSFDMTAHKGLRGVLAVFAGAPGTAGAAILAATTALSSGAGLVTLFTHADALVPVASQVASVMVRPDSTAFTEASAVTARCRAVVVGPGWGRSEERRGLLQRIIGSFDAGVVDADGLWALSNGGLERKHDGRLQGWVLTPHPGELGRLNGSATDVVLGDLYGAARAAASRYGAVVVAKTSTTVIARPDGRIAVVDGANPALATAGSGDSLSGVIGALLSRGLDAWSSACAGVVLHSVAGRRLSEREGFFRAEFLSGEIGRVLGEVLLGR